MMGLAQAMFAVQEQLPSLLKGNPIHAPSNLVHEMFSKYSNGTKTEADLASIDKGLDELFFHDFSAEDNERLVDFIGAGDLFNQETVTIQPPQLVSRRERGDEREREKESVWFLKGKKLLVFERTPPKKTQFSFKKNSFSKKKQVANKTIPYLAPDPAIAWPNVTVTQGRVKTVAYQQSKTVRRRGVFLLLRVERERRERREQKQKNQN